MSLFISINAFFKFIQMLLYLFILGIAGYDIYKNVHLLRTAKYLNNIDETPFNSAVGGDSWNDVYTAVKSYFGTEPSLWAVGRYKYDIEIEDWKLRNIKDLSRVEVISYTDNSGIEVTKMDMEYKYGNKCSVEFNIEDGAMSIIATRKNNIRETELKCELGSQYTSMTLQEVLDNPNTMNSAMMIFVKMYETLKVKVG